MSKPTNDPTKLDQLAAWIDSPVVGNKSSPLESNTSGSVDGFAPPKLEPLEPLDPTIKTNYFDEF